MKTRALLTLNSGSSSLKFQLFGMGEGAPFLLGGKVTGLGGEAVFHAHSTEDTPEETHPLAAHSTHESALAYILHWLETHPGNWQLAAAAHRIVHGGTRYTRTTRLTRADMPQLAALTPLAPLHQPHNLKAVDALWALHPDLPQYGCFDTAFHAEHSALHSTLALPKTLRAQGMRRYGFHGLSYQWIARCLAKDFPALAQGRVVVAHLGNGSSLCALHRGKSIDTTMGMSTLDGLPMGTRCGSMDAGAVLHMLQQLQLPAAEIAHILYEESGLLGLSGISNDVRTLLGSSDPRAAFALEFYAMKTAQHIATMATSLAGMDGLIFTGGIGENAAQMRERILAHLAWLPPFATHIIPANEERGMALDVAALLAE